jgi:molybdate-binding protein
MPASASRPRQRASGVDFIPLATERYVLAMTRETARQKPAQRLLAILGGQRFAENVSELRRLPGGLAGQRDRPRGARVGSPTGPA